MAERPDALTELPQRLHQVQQCIATAAAQAGRAGTEICLVAVSKRQPLAAVCAAYDAGVRHFGESTAQELQAKACGLKDSGRTDAQWHFIGRLQRNKVRAVLLFAQVIHSLDRLALLPLFAQQRSAVASTPQQVLVQVNIGREPQKSGVLPSELAALVAAWQAPLPQELARAPLVGLMAVPPRAGDPEAYFADLVALRDGLQRDGLVAPGQLRHLSMGMSDDYQQAIAYGATMVRVGSALFGARPAPASRPPNFSGGTL
jgi:pyridoxal phosphate enzyme (YggS family)